MGTQGTVSEIFANASQLNDHELSTLVGQLNLLRAQRSTPALSEKETDLLRKINEGFPSEQWSRLVELDHKMEYSALTEAESQESLILAEALEAYTIQRFEYLKQLSILQGISVEQLMDKLGIRSE
jgi:hypothetical protein